MVAAVRALDRVLISGFYAVPLFHLPEQWVARWTTIAHPAATSLMGYVPETWWRAAAQNERPNEAIVVILSDPHGRPATARTGGGATLDALFRRAVLRRPDAIALIDPPNRESFTDGAPRRLTYAQADRMISAIAGRLRRLGCIPTPSSACRLANTVDGVLALLAVLRAGLIAMPLPLLWRRADAVAALSRVGANALIVSGRIGAVDHYDLAMQVAAEAFPDAAMSAASDAILPTA